MEWRLSLQPHRTPMPSNQLDESDLVFVAPPFFVRVSVRGKTHEPIASSSLFSQPVVRRCDSPADLGTEVKRAFARAHHIYHYSFNGHSAAGSSVGKPSVSANFFWCPDLTVRLNLSYSSFFKVL